MGSQRVSDALKHLAGGLQQIAMYRGENERIAETRQFEREMQESRNAFAERLQSLQMQHSEGMLDKQQTFASSEAEKGREFQMSMFKNEQAAANARHAASLSAEWARIKQAGMQYEDAKADRDSQRQLKVHEMKVDAGQKQYSTLLEGMQKELGKLGENQMLALDKTGKLEAAQKQVQDRYQPLLDEAKKKMTEGMSAYANAVGIADFSGVEGTVQGGPGASVADRDKISAAVQAAKAQLGSGNMPSQEALIAGFVRSGLSRSEAIAAARQMQSGSP